MNLFFLAGLYFYARGVFALFGQTTFYTQRHLENIEAENIPAYLKEIGRMHMIVGTLCVGKALLDILFPLSRPILCIWLALLLVAVYFIAKIDGKYKKP